jgi:hypothetical protein
MRAGAGSRNSRRLQDALPASRRPRPQAAGAARRVSTPPPPPRGLVRSLLGSNQSERKHPWTTRQAGTPVNTARNGTRGWRRIGSATTPRRSRRSTAPSSSIPGWPQPTRCAHGCGRTRTTRPVRARTEVPTSGSRPTRPTAPSSRARPARERAPREGRAAACVTRPGRAAAARARPSPPRRPRATGPSRAGTGRALRRGAAGG